MLLDPQRFCLANTPIRLRGQASGYPNFPGIGWPFGCSLHHLSSNPHPICHEHLSGFFRTDGLAYFACLGRITFFEAPVPVYLSTTPKIPPDDFPDHVWPLWYSAYAFVHCRRFGVLFLFGIAVQTIFLVP